MWLFEKKKTKIVCKIQWSPDMFSRIKYLKVDFGCSCHGICKIYVQLGSGLEISKSRRNNQMWQVYPNKSTAIFCLRITPRTFLTNTTWRFDFWNIRQPKHISRIVNFQNQLSVGKKYITLKRRIEKWI